MVRMFKRITTIFFLLLFMAQTFHRAFIVFDFYRNQDYIAKTSCENKYRPVLQCNGKCQLAKKLQQEEKKDQSNPDRKLENKNEVFPASTGYTGFVNNATLLVSTFTLVNTGSPIDVTIDCFHPPAA